MGLYCRVAEEVILTRAMGDLLMKVVERFTIPLMGGFVASDKSFCQVALYKIYVQYTS